jgi:hypothetical protein
VMVVRYVVQVLHRPAVMDVVTLLAQEVAVLLIAVFVLPAEIQVYAPAPPGLDMVECFVRTLFATLF